MLQLKQYLEKWNFSKGVSRQVGVFFSLETLFIVVMDCCHDRVQPIAWEIILTDQERWAEDLVLFLHRNGYEECPVMLCLPESVILKTENFFPLMKEKELAIAIPWEIEEMFPQAESGYAYHAWYSKAKESTICIAALEKDKLAGFVKQAGEMEVFLAALLPVAELSIEETDAGWILFCAEEDGSCHIEGTMDARFLSAEGQQAVWAGRYQKNRKPELNLLELSVPKQEQRKKVLCMVLLVLCFFGMGFCLTVYWQLAAAEEQLQVQKEKLALLQPAMEEKRSWEEEYDDIIKNDILLEDLSKHNVAGAAILTELGFLKMTEVHLQSLSVKKKDQLDLEGAAADFDKLAGFMQELGQIQSFSECSLVYSEIAENEQGTYVHFRVRVMIKGREAGYEAGEEMQ